jgi:N-acetylglucosaminyldiphosphoundecaprenol N-acetyl-beta-D-mannosaminyltransferase
MRFPRLRIGGHHHGYFKQENGVDVITQINKANPQILFVGMGMPLQEKWIMDNAEFLPACVMFDVGACFDFVAGEKPRCPNWMADHGLEWLFRFLMEPRRLWKRYLIGNPLFLLRVMRDRQRLKKKA